MKMKKISLFIIALVLSVSLTGCGNSNNQEANKTAQNKTEETTKKEISFDECQKLLKENGYTINEVTTMAAEYIGAQEGKKYKTDKGNFEFYKFDKNSDAYKKAENAGKVTLDSFGDFDVAVNNGFALLITDGTKNIVNAFKNI